MARGFYALGRAADICHLSELAANATVLRYANQLTALPISPYIAMIPIIVRPAERPDFDPNFQ
jgi:hypothetical protein